MEGQMKKNYLPCCQQTGFTKGSVEVQLRTLMGSIGGLLKLLFSPSPISLSRIKTVNLKDGKGDNHKVT